MMKEKFQELINEVAAIKKGNHWLKKTFEGQLFSHVPEYLYFFKPNKGAKEVLKDNSSKEHLFTGENEVREEIVTLEPTQKEENLSKIQKEKVLFLGHLNLKNKKGKSSDNSEEALVTKMGLAMNLSKEQFDVHWFKVPEDSGEEFSFQDKAGFLKEDDVSEIITKFKPSVVIVLGSLVTNVLLGRRERLSRVHGEIFKKTFSDITFSWMPIFHPEYLLINPAMKRTTWLDLLKLEKDL